MTAVAVTVDLDATLPAVEPEPDFNWKSINDSWPVGTDADELVKESLEMEQDRLKRQVRFLQTRPDRAWYITQIVKLNTRISAAMRKPDPELELQTYLDELVFLQAELRQVLDTVREYAD